MSDSSPLGESGVSRRRLITGAAAGIALTALPDWFVREARAQDAVTALAQPRRIGANDTIQVGAIGLGGSTPGSFHQGLNDTRAIAGQKGVKIVALCDVDAKHLAEAKGIFPDARLYIEFTDLIARPDIDAVVIGAPDHWHALMASAALRAGKDVYCEKPLTLTIAEGRRLVDLTRQNNRVFQTGSQQRSDARFRLACELVRNGRIGKIKQVTAHIPTARSGGPFPVIEPPRGFAWDLWQGPTPPTPYIKERTHGSFRYWYEYAGGMVTDWGAHHMDITQWGLGRDNSGPVKIDGKGKLPTPDPTKRSYNVHTAFEINYVYDDGTPVKLTTEGENGVRFDGEDGKWIFVSRSKIEASDPKLIADPLPDDRPVKLYVSGNHAANFVECIRSRQMPICDVEIGHRSATACHLGNLSLRLDRSLEWDPVNEEFKGDREANDMRSRPINGPWTL